VVEIKDDYRGTQRGFYWSRPRIVGLVFAAVASPIYFAFASLGHETLGGILWFAAGTVLMIAYLLPTPIRRFVQRLIPTSAERAERLRVGRGSD